VRLREHESSCVTAPVLIRSVGIESDAELACALVAREACLDPERVKEQICRLMPQGCEITSVELLPGKVSYQPISVVYVFSLACSNGDERIGTAVEDLRRTLAAGDELVVQRRSHPTKPARRIDIISYIDSVETEPTGLEVKCNITGAGTVRPDEILQLLQIDSWQLLGPVKRKSVQWRRN
jgi:hypothetical protein